MPDGDPPRLVAGPADIVHRFDGIGSGMWCMGAQTYVPSNQDGEMYIVLLNTYAPGGANNNWSVQLAMCNNNCTTAGAVPGHIMSLGGTDVPGGGGAPLITDQWVGVMVEFDFAENLYAVFYDGVEIDRQQWTIGGALELGAIDLFSNGSTVSYIDGIWLDRLPIFWDGFETGDTSSWSFVIP